MLRTPHEQKSDKRGGQAPVAGKTAQLIGSELRK
jgi:hypothetical protein